ncbi:MAG: acyltransferase [Prevotella sp.]|nr:acyltransferase [Prevotella sp.]
MARERNFEVMRTWAMFSIVIYHCMCHGIGSDYAFDLQLPVSLFNFTFSDFILVIGSIAVNLYVLVSGYFLVNARFKVSRIIRTWVSALFYSVIITTMFLLLSLEPWSIVTLGKSFFPLSTDAYWFVTQYVGLLILSPFLAMLVRQLSYRQYVALLIGMGLMVLSVIPDFPLGKRFSISHGNSVWSFVYLFFIAGFIRLHLKRIPMGKLAMIILGLALLTMVSEMVLGIHNGVGHLLWFNYNGILLFLSVAVFVFIRQQQIPETGIWSLMVKVAPYTFGVYLIHDHLLMRDWIWKTLSMTSYANQWIYALAVMVVCVLIFAICILIDTVRKRLFAILKMDDLMIRLDGRSYFSKLFT